MTIYIFLAAITALGLIISGAVRFQERRRARRIVRRLIEASSPVPLDDDAAIRAAKPWAEYRITRSAPKFRSYYRRAA